MPDAAMAATTPMSSGGVAPKIGAGSSGNAWATSDADEQPANAHVSIIPSMPMLTTPERSLMTPHRAPSAIGAASAQDDRRDRRHDVDQEADQLEDEPEDRDVETGTSISGPSARLAAVRAGDRLELGDRRRLARPEPEDPAHDDVGGQEEQDDRLDHVDHLDRDAGLDLHQRGAGAHGAEQQRGEQDRRTGATAPSSATVIASNPIVVP